MILTMTNKRLPKVGDTVRSYDFAILEIYSSYVVGEIVAIGPVNHINNSEDDFFAPGQPMCGPECDHLHIRAASRVHDGERQECAGQMFYPHYPDSGTATATTERIEIIEDECEHTTTDMGGKCTHCLEQL